MALSGDGLTLFWATGRTNLFILEEGGEIMAKDPVCGMEVNEKEAAGISEYKGKKYYFCNPGCKERFQKDPEKYLEKEKY